MSSLNSIFGSSFNEGFDFKGFSRGAMEKHNRHSHPRSRERSPHEKSSRDSNRKEKRRSQRRQARKRPRLPSLSPSSSSSAKTSRTSASQSGRSARHSQPQDSASSRNPPRRRDRQDARSGPNGGDYSSRIVSRQPTNNGVLDRRIDCLENAIKQIAAHMVLFKRQDEHGDNSRDVDRNSVSSSRENEHEAREEQEVQDGGRGVSDGVDEEPQIQDGGLDRAEEANRDVSEERLQDDRVSIQASDGEFPEHHSLEAIFFDPEPDTESKWQPQEAIANYITKFSAKNQKMKLFTRI